MRAQANNNARALAHKNGGGAGALPVRMRTRLASVLLVSILNSRGPLLPDHPQLSCKEP